MDSSVSKKGEQKKKPVELDFTDPQRYFCDRAFIVNGAEHFVLALQTGSVINGQYAFTPKHMKRLMLRLQEKMGEYEKEYGELKVELPTKEDAMD